MVNSVSLGGSPASEADNRGIRGENVRSGRYGGVIR